MLRLQVYPELLLHGEKLLVLPLGIPVVLRAFNGIQIHNVLNLVQRYILIERLQYPQLSPVIFETGFQLGQPTSRFFTQFLDRNRVVFLLKTPDRFLYLLDLHVQLPQFLSD